MAVPEFTWRGHQISSLENLYQTVRHIADQGAADEFRAAFAAVEPEAEMLLGYVIGEFEVVAERARYVSLFRVEHPMMGGLEDLTAHSFKFKYLMGVLYGDGYSPMELRQVRELARGISPDAASEAVNLIMRLESRPPALVNDILRAVMRGCGANLAH